MGGSTGQSGQLAEEGVGVVGGEALLIHEPHLLFGDRLIAGRLSPEGA